MNRIAVDRCIPILEVIARTMAESRLHALEHRVDIAITFDFDAETIWMQRSRTGEGGISADSRGAFGAKVGIYRILDLLSAYDVRATFFVPGWVAEKWPAAIGAILDKDHEVGLHGYLHERTSDLVDRRQEEMVVATALAAIQKVTTQPVFGYRPPGYNYSPWSLEVLPEAGFRYGSAMQDDDAPYVHATDHLFAEIPVKWWLADDSFGWAPNVFLPPSHVSEHWLSELRELPRYPGRIFVPTLHPQVIGHPGRLPVLEAMIQLGVELGARFRTCLEIADDALAVHAAAKASASDGLPR